MKQKGICFYLILLMLVLYSCTSTNTTQNNIENIELVNEYILLSEEYVSLEEYDKALQLLLKAQDFTSHNNELQYLIARNATLAQQWSIAIENYLSLQSLDTENVMLQKSIAWVHAQSGDLEKAELLFQSLYELHSYDKEICTNYIIVLAANNDTEKARAILIEFAQKYPDEPNLENLRERIYDIENGTASPSDAIENDNTKLES